MSMGNHPANPAVDVAPAPRAAADRAGARRRLSPDHLWLLLPLIALFVWLGSVSIHPADFWWHLRTGQEIARAGRVPAVDFLTFTRAGRPWANQAWLTEWLLYLLYRAGGLPLVLLLYRVGIVAGYALVEVACLRQPHVRARHAALAVLLAMLLGHLNWGVRPQAVSFLCFGALVFIIEQHNARGGRVVWLLPPLFALWANLHGGFVFGLGLLGIYVLARSVPDLVARRTLSRETLRLVLAGALSLLALGLVPAGPLGTVRYVAGFLQSSTTLGNNQEFLPLSIRERDGLLFFLVMGGFIFLVARRRVRLPAYQVAGMSLLALLSLYSRRVLPWFGMAAAPAFARALAPQSEAAGSPQRVPRNRPLLNYLFVAVAAAAVVLSLPWVRPLLPNAGGAVSFLDARWTPVEAARRLCDLDGDVRAFADISYASYLTWACPSAPVFMDTRFELYPSDMWQEYLLVANGQYGWEAVLEKYGIEAILADKEREKLLVAAARASGEWETLYEDANAALLRRAVPSS